VGRGKGSAEVIRKLLMPWFLQVDIARVAQGLMYSLCHSLCSWRHFTEFSDLPFWDIFDYTAPLEES